MLFDITFSADGSILSEESGILPGDMANLDEAYDACPNEPERYGQTFLAIKDWIGHVQVLVIATADENALATGQHSYLVATRR